MCGIIAQKKIFWPVGLHVLFGKARIALFVQLTRHSKLLLNSKEQAADYVHSAEICIALNSLFCLIYIHIHTPHKLMQNPVVHMRTGQ